MGDKDRALLIYLDIDAYIFLQLQIRMQISVSIDKSNHHVEYSFLLIVNSVSK